eukprot:COSAG01_NODE_51127_length_357_cov_0.996124_1_plen_57_part_01
MTAWCCRLRYCRPPGRWVLGPKKLHHGWLLQRARELGGVGLAICTLRWCRRWRLYCC